MSEIWTQHGRKRYARVPRCCETGAARLLGTASLGTCGLRITLPEQTQGSLRFSFPRAMADRPPQLAASCDLCSTEKRRRGRKSGRGFLTTWSCPLQGVLDFAFALASLFRFVSNFKLAPRPLSSGPEYDCASSLPSFSLLQAASFVFVWFSDNRWFAVFIRFVVALFVVIDYRLVSRWHRGRDDVRN